MSSQRAMGIRDKPIAPGRKHGCTARKRDDFPCQLGAVHTWHFSECRERTLTSRCRPISIYEDLGDATKERWNAPGFRERRHAPVRPCPHTVPCGFRGRIGGDGDARWRERPLQLQSCGRRRAAARHPHPPSLPCSRSDVGWACKVVPDERSALETEIARLQGENASLKKDLLARGLPAPGVSGPSGAKPGEPELKLPSDAEIDKVISFLEKV